MDDRGAYKNFFKVNILMKGVVCSKDQVQFDARTFVV